MARVDNPRKNFQFNIIIPGLDPFLCQVVKAPDIELDDVEHGDAGYMVKTAGMEKTSKLSIEKISRAETTDTFMRAWQKRIMNTFIGGGQLPSQYKLPIIVEELSANGISVIDRQIYEGCWPQKINGKDFTRKGSDNTVENVEFSVDRPIN